MSQPEKNFRIRRKQKLLGEAIGGQQAAEKGN